MHTRIDAAVRRTGTTSTRRTSTFRSWLSSPTSSRSVCTKAGQVGKRIRSTNPPPSIPARPPTHPPFKVVALLRWRAAKESSSVTRARRCHCARRAASGLAGRLQPCQHGVGVWRDETANKHRMFAFCVPPPLAWCCPATNAGAADCVCALQLGLEEGGEERVKSECV